MKKEALYFSLALILCALVFIGDLLIGRGYVEWLLYIVPLLLIYLAGRPSLTYVLLGVIGVLLGIGFLVSPDPGIPKIISLTDRLEGFVVFLAYTLIINALIRSRKANVEARISAEEKSEEISVINKELEAFSYSISHDLRNPLQAIGNFVELLREDYRDSLDEDGHEYLRRIDIAVGKMQQLIDDLLSLSKISRQDLKRENNDLSAMAALILNELAHAHPERRVSWHVQDAMWIDADTRLVNIALSNLLGNAWKYTGKTENAKIEVGMEKQEQGTVYYVRDNGAGFDMRRADTIFAPFRRLHSEREFSGTGIGLAIVERIVQRHGGQIRAESQVGKGATFYFTLE
ncbi:MAG: GHKL domain-containing protein [Chitinivibrionales bacterium]|nr:GHKL domain-containing protein [Chitinivibrionales bacterium]